MGARRSFASRVGAAVAAGARMRATADERGQPRSTLNGLLHEESRHKRRSTVQARENGKKKTKAIILYSAPREGQLHLLVPCTVPYPTLQNTVQYFAYY